MRRRRDQFDEKIMYRPSKMPPKKGPIRKRRQSAAVSSSMASLSEPPINALYAMGPVVKKAPAKKAPAKKAAPPAKKGPIKKRAAAESDDGGDSSSGDDDDVSSISSSASQSNGEDGGGNNGAAAQAPPLTSARKREFTRKLAQLFLDFNVNMYDEKLTDDQRNALREIVNANQ